jgi:hypothetical protein
MARHASVRAEHARVNAGLFGTSGLQNLISAALATVWEPSGCFATAAIPIRKFGNSTYVEFFGVYWRDNAFGRNLTQVSSTGEDSSHPGEASP